MSVFAPLILNGGLPEICGVQIEGSIAENVQHLAERSAVHDQIR